MIGCPSQKRNRFVTLRCINTTSVALSIGDESMIDNLAFLTTEETRLDQYNSGVRSSWSSVTLYGLHFSDCRGMKHTNIYI